METPIIYSIRLHASDCSSTSAGQGGSVTDLTFSARYLVLGLTKHGLRRADAGTQSGSLLCVCVCVCYRT